MKRMLAIAFIPIVLCAPSMQGWAMKKAPSGSLSRIEFNKAMRELWNDHAIWTRDYIIGAVADLPSTATAAKRLLKNQEDIGNAIAPFYGRAAANKLTSLLKEHITIAVDLIAAAKKGNTKLYKSIDEKWHKNALEISSFLSKANPHISHNDMVAEMNEHLKLTGDEAGARLKKNWAEDVEIYDAVRKQLNGMSDMLSDAIVMQFPSKFQQ